MEGLHGVEWAVLGLGLVLGLRHAADPDHVVAVVALSARTRRIAEAAWLGVVWGLGHTLTLFVVGAAILLFNLTVPPRVGLSLELVVALALVVVGLLNIRRAPAAAPGSGDGRRRVPALRTFVMGLLHGLAGSAAVALLVLATVRDVAWACGYLLLFGAGTLIGMVLITTGMASPLAWLGGRRDLTRVARLATGTLSLVVGLWLIYQIGWQDGLFRATPRWDPH